ncbi:MAG: hypothetical protein Kow0031_05710 [Anaerolineae bacterium]
MKVIKLYLFGPTQIWIKGQSISQFRSHKIRDLLIYLTVNANQPQQRNGLAALLWSDYPDQVARTNLRNTLAQLRKLLAPVLADTPDFLRSTRHIIQINFDSQAHYCDVHQVEAALATYQTHRHENRLLCLACLEGLTQSVAHYQAEFLSSLGQKDSSLFADWLLEKQEYYHRHNLRACNAVAEHYFASGDYGQAETYLRRQLSLEPWLEQVHHRLIHTLALSGQRGAALAQYERCQQILAQELGVEPGPATTTCTSKFGAVVCQNWG